jgi:hypothetical protein
MYAIYVVPLEFITRFIIMRALLTARNKILNGPCIYRRQTLRRTAQECHRFPRQLLHLLTTQQIITPRYLFSRYFPLK